MLVDMPQFHESIALRRPRGFERRQAWRLALGTLPPDVRASVVASRDAFATEESDGLLAAWRGERLVGAVWGEVHPGRAAVAHLPQVIRNEPRETRLALLAGLESYFRQRKAKFYQIQIEELAPHTAGMLGEAGLQHAGDLLYLASELIRQSPPAETVLEFEPFHESHCQGLADVVEQTYVGSLDLPALDGVRTMDEVLEGYRHTGRFRPEFWKLVHHEGAAVGCVLLAEHSDEQWELIYMGVKPEARGQGFGLAITHHAQRVASAAGGRRLWLAVDASNQPALQIYARAGFRPMRRSAVFLKILHGTISN